MVSFLSYSCSIGFRDLRNKVKKSVFLYLGEWGQTKIFIKKKIGRTFGLA